MNLYLDINECNILLTIFLKLSADKIFPKKNLCIVKNNLGFFCSRINRKITRKTNKYQTLVNSGR